MADKKYIEELIARDKAMPVNKYVPITEGIAWAICPKCGRMLITNGKEDEFCPRCGQRVDLTTWAL